MNPSVSLILWENICQHYQGKNLTYKTGNKDGNVVSLAVGTKHFSVVRGRHFLVSEVEKVVRRGYITPNIASLKMGHLQWDAACMIKHQN